MADQANPPKEKPVVIFIDDEAKILQIAKKMLENPEYDFYAYNNAEEALKFMEHRKVAVVLSDNRMPHMKGVEFFERIKLISPLTVRVLTTAFYDDDLVETAVNKGEIFRFLKKPLDFDLARIIIKLGLEHYKKGIEEAEKVSLFEKLLRKLTQARQKDEQLAGEVAHLKKNVRSLTAALVILALSFAGYELYQRVAERFQHGGGSVRVGDWVKYPRGVAVDTKSDLMWMTRDFRIIEQRYPQSWDEAMAWAAKINEQKFGGFGDWRIPTIAEYQKSYDPDRIRLAFNDNKDFPVGYPKAFEDGGGYGFWAKDEGAEEGTAKFFFFAGGYEKIEKKDYNNNTMSVRLVRNP